MQRLVLAALAAVSAQAFDALLSGPDYNFNDAATLHFHVTFESCVDTLDASLFDISPDIASGAGACTMVDAQTWDCSYPVETGMHQRPTNVFVHLPAGLVGNVGGGSTNDQSNTLNIHYYPALGPGELSTRPNLSMLDDPLVTFKYWFNRDVWVNDTSQVSFTQAGQAVTPEAVHYGANEWTFIVHADPSKDLIGKVGAGAAEDLAGNGNTDSNMIMRSFAGAMGCRKMWSEWSDCQATCKGGYNNDFTPNPPVQTRSIIEIPGDPGTPPCSTVPDPPGDATQPCEGSFPWCYDKGSRPRSGEDGLECRSPMGTATCSTASRPAMEDGSIVDDYLEESGCRCDPGCEPNGSCCQVYWTSDCCSGGDCVNQFSQYVFPSSQFPYKCPADGSQCGNFREQMDPNFPSYYCYCDIQCEKDHSCCFGETDPMESRPAVCGA